MQSVLTIELGDTAPIQQLVEALQQTATELLRLYDAAQHGEPFEPLDVDAVDAWERIATKISTTMDLKLISMRRTAVIRRSA